jgi:hypothetical protein
MPHRALLLVLALLFVTATAHAQEFHGGVKGGANFATISGDDFDETKTLTAGGFRRIGIQPEFLYMMKGTKADDDDFSVELKLGYIEVPVLARISLAPGNGAMDPHLLLGPAVSFNTSCKWDGREGGFRVEIDCSEFEDARTVDFGVVVGGGVAIPLGGFSLLLDGRYNLGLTSVFEDVDGNNRTFSAMAGISMPFGRRELAGPRR